MGDFPGLSREVQGSSFRLRRQPLLKLIAESLTGRAPAVSPRRGACGGRPEFRDCSGAVGLPRGQRSEAARRGNRRIGWEGEAPAVERNVRGGAWRGATQKRSPRPVMSDTGTCLRTHPGPPGGGSVYYGALFVTRYGVRPGKMLRDFRRRAISREGYDGRGTMEALLTFNAKRQRGAKRS